MHVAAVLFCAHHSPYSSCFFLYQHWNCFCMRCVNLYPICHRGILLLSIWLASLVMHIQRHCIVSVDKSTVTGEPIVAEACGHPPIGQCPVAFFRERVYDGRRPRASATGADWNLIRWGHG